MYNSGVIQIGDEVLILRPAYVMGKVGVVCATESNPHNQGTTRWIIQIDSENIIVSLTHDDFTPVNSKQSSR